MGRGHNGGGKGTAALVSLVDNFYNTGFDPTKHRENRVRKTEVKSEALGPTESCQELMAPWEPPQLNTEGDWNGS